MTTKLIPVFTKIGPILAKQTVPLGGNVCVDFGADGAIYVYGKTVPMRAVILGQAAQADCTIALSLDELAKLQSGEDSITWDVVTGKVHIDNRALAEKAAAIIQGAK
jgi:hypothetical protein